MADLFDTDPYDTDPGTPAPTGPAPLFELDAVHVDYPTPAGPVPAVEEVTCALPATGISTFAGPSGSGKSTLLRVLGLIDRPTRGGLRFDGADVGRLDNRRRRALRRARVAIVFQSPTENLIGHLTVAGNLTAAAQAAGVEANPEEILDWLGVGGTGAWPVSALSGGQQQRLAFGCALARRPSVVLADEPTSQLDAASATLVLDTIDRLAADGVPVVTASHDDELIARSDLVVRLREGRLTGIEDGRRPWLS